MLGPFESISACFHGCSSIFPSTDCDEIGEAKNYNLFR